MKTNKEHIENEFPTLEKLKGEMSFKTPKGYFDSLEKNILSQLPTARKVRQISIYKIISYAASVILILGISSVFFFNRNGQSNEEVLGDITVSEYMEGFIDIDLELEDALPLDEVALN